MTNEEFLQYWCGDNLHLVGIERNGGSPKRYTAIDAAKFDNANETNIYLHGNPVAPEFTGTKATEDDIPFIHRITLDFDPPKGFDPARTKPFWHRVLEVVNQDKNPIPLTGLFHTGRLGTGWLQLAQPVPNDDLTRTRIKTLHKRLCIAFNADDGGDSAHLFKAPLQGTKAWMKDSKREAGWPDSDLGETYWFNPERTYTLEQLEAAVAHVPVDDKSEQGDRNAAAESGWFGRLGAASRDAHVDSMLASLCPKAASYDMWLRVGMALHDAGDEYFDKWDEWSAGDPDRYDADEMEAKWGKFKFKEVRFGTLVYLAKEAGWDREQITEDEGARIIEALSANPKDKDAINEAVRLWMTMDAMDQRPFALDCKDATNGLMTLGYFREVGSELSQQDRREDGDGDQEPDDGMTHMEIAEDYTSKVREQGFDLAYTTGTMWTAKDDNIWFQNEPEVLRSIASNYREEPRCKRESDYKGVLESVRRQSENTEFFREATKGIACKSGIAFVGTDAQGNEIVNWEPLEKRHRQVFRLDFDPSDNWDDRPERLITALKEGMGVMAEAQKEEQILLLSQMAGLGLMGLLPSEQRALLMKGPAASGKSLFLNTLAQLLPPDAICHVEPSDMSDPKLVLDLGHARLNILTEASNNKAIAGDGFKKVIAGEGIMAWRLYVGAFNVTPTAGTLMAANHFPTTTDNSDGFWRRWAIVLFRYSIPEDQRDKLLADKIIEEEGPALLTWILRGVQTYLANGRHLCLGDLHYQSLQEWQRQRDSVMAFIHECRHLAPCDNIDQAIRKDEMYTLYQGWMKQTEYRQSSIVGRNHFYERLEGMGIVAKRDRNREYKFAGYRMVTVVPLDPDE